MPGAFEMSTIAEIAKRESVGKLSDSNIMKCKMDLRQRVISFDKWNTIEPVLGYR